jgi:large subunit ribosomal protein L6
LGTVRIPQKKLDPKGFVLFRVDPQWIHFHFLSKNKTKLFAASRGYIEALFHQTFQGLMQGYLLQLELIGVGFRVEQINQTLEFKLGYSHTVVYTLPADIRAIVSKQTQFSLYGIDANRLTQVGAEIKRLRLPELYKGKGIRLTSDVLYLKDK